MKLRYPILNNILKLTIVLYIVLLTCRPIQVCAYTGNGDEIVHVTNTGSCYHDVDCKHLRSDIPMALEAAYVEGYQPCDDCNPPVYTGTAKRGALKEKSVSSGSGTSYERKRVRVDYSSLDNRGIYSSNVFLINNIFHREECDRLSSKKVSMRKHLIEAYLSGARPCDNCNPPVMNDDQINLYKEYQNNTTKGDAETVVVRSDGYIHRARCLEINDNNKEVIKLKLVKDSDKYCIYCNPPVYKKPPYGWWIAGSAFILYWMCRFLAGIWNREKQTKINNAVDRTNTNTSSKEALFVYRTPKGNVFHVDQDCKALANSKSIIKMNIVDARKGWRTPCHLCSKKEIGTWNSLHNK